MADDLIQAWDEIDEWMIGDLADGDEPTPDEIPDQRVANARLRLLGRLRRQRATKLAAYEAELERLKGYKTRVIDGALGKAIADEEHWLANWHAAQLGEHGTGPKTIHLPAGRLESRGQPFQLVIDDEEAFLRWAGKNAGALVAWSTPPPPTQRVDRKGLRKLANVPKGSRPGEAFDVSLPDGTAIPGVRAVAQAPSFTPVVADEEDAATVAFGNGDRP